MTKLIVRTQSSPSLTNEINAGVFQRFYDATIPELVFVTSNSVSAWIDRGTDKINPTIPSTVVNQPLYTTVNGIRCLDFRSTANRNININFPTSFTGNVYISTNRGLLKYEITRTIPNNTTIFFGTQLPLELSTYGINMSDFIFGIMMINSAKINELTSSGSMEEIEAKITAWHQSKTGESNFKSKTNFANRFSTGNNSPTVNVFENYISNFPSIDITSTTELVSTWGGRTLRNGITNIPRLNYRRITNFGFTWIALQTLTTSDFIDLTAGTFFRFTWGSTTLSQDSVNKLYISLAAGLANNPTKVVANISNGAGTEGTFQNQLEPNNNVYDLESLLLDYPFLTNLRNVNETLGGVAYNFSIGITARQARNWMKAKSSTWNFGADVLNLFLRGLDQASYHNLSTDTFSTFGSVSGDQSKWTGGVLAPNGMIYGIPFSATSILKIDPTNDTVSTFGSLSGSAKWTGGVLAPNGMIYGIPRDATSILKIDPNNDTVSTFGSLSGSLKWTGGVLAPNGMIYGIPTDATSILKIDPTNDTASTFGSLSGSSKWAGGVLAPNGMIYGIPSGATSILKIDPTNDTASTFGSLSGSSKWAGGVLAPNGMIYGIPSSGTSILKINPTNDTASTFGDVSGDPSKWYGGVLAPNGMIYGIPRDTASILKINPTNDTISTFGSLGGVLKWIGGVLAPNGMIYGIPVNATNILRILNETPVDDILLSAYVNKL
jgi:hypothetical protein